MGMSRIFWDSNLFIYFFEGSDDRSVATKQLRQKMLDRGDQLFTSMLTVGEILVKPAANGDEARCRLYEDVLVRTSVILPFDLKSARRFAAIRSTTSVKGPDAIQLACAAVAGIDLFVTNDNHLKGKQVEGIQFIVALDQVPL
jgi:predicted nucleic acid-binding protein